MSEVAHRWKLMVPVVVLCTVTVGVVIENATEGQREAPIETPTEPAPPEMSAPEESSTPELDAEAEHVGASHLLRPPDAPELQRIFAQLESQVAEVERLVHEIHWAPNVVSEMLLRQEYERVVADVQTRVEQLRSEGRLSFRPYAQRFDVEILKPLELARRELTGSCYPGPSSAALGELAESMQTHLAAGEPEAALAAFDSVAVFIERVAQGPRAGPQVRRIRDLAVQAGLLAEFSALSIEIQSIELEGPEPQVVIDGIARRQGDALTDDLVIGAIQGDAVELIYKGVTLVRRF